VWECSIGEGNWQEIRPSPRPDEKDTTGGLNNPRGRLVLYLPLAMRPDQVNGREGYWVRCRFEQRRAEQGKYSESPRILNVEAYALGATTLATHAVIIRNEVLGVSNGEPNQLFGLRHAPILDLRSGETLHVEESRHGETVFAPWRRVADFSDSDRYDRHFTLDTATGEINFGPAIRQRDGTVHQYGRIPEAGRTIRFSQYRDGGGVAGNVPVGRIQVLKSAVPYIDQVINMKQAAGGRDQEHLDEAKLRAAREMRAQLRAVTAEDYENLAKGASRQVARVKCNIPQGSNGRLPPGMVEILIVPAVSDSLRSGNLTKLAIDEALVQQVADHLDSYRLLTTTLQIREPSYLGVSVEAEIVPADYSLPEVVIARVNDVLNNFINPLLLSEWGHSQNELMEADWEGWPFGRNLYVAEIFSLIQRVPGVKHVLDVELHTRQVTPSHEVAPGDDLAVDEPPPLQKIRKKLIRVPADTLLCSLHHTITIADLGDEDDND
jgi:predicted phage baseplate assembly protein